MKDYTNKEKFDEVMRKYFGAPYPEGVMGFCREGDAGGISFSKDWANAKYSEKSKVTGWERVKNGNVYYVIDSTVADSVTDISSYLEEEDECDNRSYTYGNYFSNEQLAEIMSRRISLMLRMQRWADEHNDKVDWNDTTVKKYYIFYDHIRNCLRTDFMCKIETCGIIWFSSDAVAKEAIKVFGDEIIKDRLERVNYNVDINK